MKWQQSLAVLAAAAFTVATGAATMTGSASAMTVAARTAASADPAGHLGAAQPVPGLAALNAGGQAQVSFLSCPSPGFCTAAGSYVDGAGHNQAFVVIETNFAWQKATPVPGLSALGPGHPSDVTSLSCADADHCAVGGWYVDPSGNLQAFVSDSTRGTWDNAHRLVFPDPSAHEFVSLVNSLSCTGPGDCTAAVTLPIAKPGGKIVRFPVIVAEKNGTWGAPEGVPGVADERDAQVTSLSCWSTGNCLAGGYYTPPAGNVHPFVATESDGTWGHAAEPPGITGPTVIGYDPTGNSQVMSVACTTAGNCTVGGVYTDIHGGQQLFEADEVNTAWKIETLPGSAELNGGADAVINAMSCGLPFDCAAAGQVTDTANQSQAFVAGESGGKWRNAEQVLGVNDNPNAAAFAVSCSANRHCIAGGAYTGTDGNPRAFITYENDDTSTPDVGTFGGATQVAGNLNVGGNAAVNAVSCSFGWECAIGGFYTDASGNSQGFIAEQSTATTTSLSVSAGTITVGSEGSEHITVKVASPVGGAPTGTVSVITSTQVPICSITLSGGSNGSGECTMPAGSLPAGNYNLIANYSGDQDYSSSQSASGGGGLSIHVVSAPAATSTTLALSAAKAKFGHEQAERLTATVSAQAAGTPTGKVTFLAGKAAVCVATLSASGKATCTLKASQLKPGIYHLTASYGGDLAHKASLSGAKTLTITR